MCSEIIFKKDFDSTSIYVMKIFAADVITAWQYFTKAEYIDKWWGPKPWQCETIKLDFTENGIWHYAMKSPNGEKVFCVAKYGEITEHRSFDQESRFSDDKGLINPEMPDIKWLYGFTGVEGGTKLTVNLKISTKEKMQQLLQMGFEEGLKITFNQLEDILLGG